MRPRLLLIHSSDEMYGADRVVIDIVRAAEPDFEVELWLPTDLAHPARPLCERVAGRAVVVRHERLPILRRADFTPSGLARLARSSATILRRLRRARPDVVYCATSAALMCAPLARLARGARVVLHVHEVWSAGDRRVLGPLARRAHVVLCISEAVRASLPPDLRARAALLANATREPEEVVELAGRSGPLHFLVASRWNAWKGHGTLLAAWDRLAEPGLLTVLGGPPLSGGSVDVPSLVAGLRHPESVRVVGEVADIDEHLRAADVMLVPSDAPEPFGLVAIEAFAAARPVVASRGGGLADVVDESVTGWLFTPGDVGALAELLAGLRRQTVERGGRAARQTYLERYTPARFALEWRRTMAAATRR